MFLNKTYFAKRSDNDEYVTGPLLFDSDFNDWKIVTNFFDIEQPKTSNQFGVTAFSVIEETIKIL